MLEHVNHLVSNAFLALRALRRPCAACEAHILAEGPGPCTNGTGHGVGALVGVNPHVIQWIAEALREREPQPCIQGRTTAAHGLHQRPLGGRCSLRRPRVDGLVPCRAFSACVLPCLRLQAGDANLLPA